MILEDKFRRLKDILLRQGSIAIAFSGGVDSTFLLAVAVDILGNNNVIAVTALSPTYPERMKKESELLAKKIGVEHVFVESNELEIPGFADNPADRCYYCKRELFEVIKRIAKEKGIKSVADGNNFDDKDDYRPGMKAACELHVLHPLMEAGFKKDDIRELSRKMNLSTADIPAFACLASRFPYGRKITDDGLKAVDTVEQAVRGFGIQQVRARHYGDTVRIEVEESDIKRMVDDNVRLAIVDVAKSVGFKYIALDMQGYRTGSLNETLDLQKDL